jgi:hypothetical protein
MAACNSMFHRLFKIPLSDEHFHNELNYIFETAKLNGYEESTMKRLFQKHKNKNELREITTLTSSSMLHWKNKTLSRNPLQSTLK